MIVPNDQVPAGSGGPPSQRATRAGGTAVIRGEIWQKSYLRDLHLMVGRHPDRSNGLCVMEAAAWAAGESHSDHPACVSRVIGEFCRSWNDDMDETDRQMLKPYVLKVIGTNTGAADDTRRAWLAVDWLVRVQAPAWLELCGLVDRATVLRRLGPVLDMKRAETVRPSIIAAISTTLGAALSPAYSAALSPARSAAYRAADSAALSAALGAAYRAADSAAVDAALSLAYNAAYRAAYRASRPGVALEPTVRELQKQALKLLDAMIRVGR